MQTTQRTGASRLNQIRSSKNKAGQNGGDGSHLLSFFRKTTAQKVTEKRDKLLGVYAWMERRKEKKGKKRKKEKKEGKREEKRGKKRKKEGKRGKKRKKEREREQEMVMVIMESSS